MGQGNLPETGTKRGQAPRAHSRSVSKPAVLLTVVSAIAALAALVGLGLAYIRQSTTQVLIPTVALLPTLPPTETPTPRPTLVVTSTPISPTPTITPLPTETMPAVITATTLPVMLTSTEQATVTATALESTAERTEAPATDQAVSTGPNPCIALVGDSVTHGGVTYEVPATGYIVGLTKPLSMYVEEALVQAGRTDLKVLDRGASNTGISSTNHPSYFKTDAYKALRADHCQYTMIMPWLNDISPGIAQDIAAPRHVRALIGLVQDLVTDNPEARVIVLDYFHGAVAPFAANTWASGFTPEDVDLYNHEIGLSCNYGTLAEIPQVSCVNIDDAFVGMGDNYVIGLISHEDLTASLIAPLHPVQQAWLDQYYAVNPDGLLQGDGVHLSIAGKKALATFLVKLL